MNGTGGLPANMFPSLASELRKHWGWLLALGILLTILGIIALVDSVTASVVSMLVFGWILVIAGIIEGVQTVRHRGNGHLFLHLVNTVLAIVVGVMLLRRPVAGVVFITLLLAIYFIVAGVFRIAMAWSARVPGWGLGLLNGIVTLILGILIWAHWPGSGLWVIGLFIGIDLIFVGGAQIMTALALRSLPVSNAAG
ncbi:MAG TPA: HdeD family acid-resistance protein [Steroidobacteraceae bacterium]|nr:HdeD family acid-resistance protein [Steroidobacteraceae bacterium]